MEDGDHNSICRLCLGGGERLVYIFKQNYGQLCVPEIINNFLRIEVSEGDGYPPYVCTLCYNKLTDIKQFRDQCVQSRLTYDAIKGDKTAQQNCRIQDELLEPPTEVKKESEDFENDLEAEQIPLDIVKTELTEEEGVFSVGSSEGSSLPLSPPEFQEETQQQFQGGAGGCGGQYKYKCAQYEMAVRLWKDRVRQARRRAMESEEERQRRLAQDRERTRARRAKESPEEKARRLERARVYMAEKRRRLVAMVNMENHGVYQE